MAIELLRPNQIKFQLISNNQISLVTIFVSVNFSNLFLTILANFLENMTIKC